MLCLNPWALLIFCRIYLVIRFIQTRVYSPGTRILGNWANFEFRYGGHWVSDGAESNHLAPRRKMAIVALTIISDFLKAKHFFGSSICDVVTVFS